MIATLCGDPVRDRSNTNLIIGCIFNSLAFLALGLRLANHLPLNRSRFTIDDGFAVLASVGQPITSLLSLPC